MWERGLGWFEGGWMLEGEDSRALRKEGGKVRGEGVEVVGEAAVVVVVVVSFMGVSSIFGGLRGLLWLIAW